MKKLIYIAIMTFSINATANAALHPFVMFPAFFLLAESFVDLDRPIKECTNGPELLVKRNDSSNYNFVVTSCDYESKKDTLIVISK